MTLPLSPGVRPMLARLARELPEGDYVYEPKWDGFRCLVFRDGDDVDLRSRNDRSLARYFPELVAAFRQVRQPRFVVDGEILVIHDGHAAFESLMARLHPAASRAQRLSLQTPASFVAFDVLAIGDGELLAQPFAARRAALEQLLSAAPPAVVVTPATADRDAAAVWFEHATGGGLDGVIAKQNDRAYEPGKRTMVKVKPLRTADCVVTGGRVFADPVAVASLLLGLHDEGGVLRHVGIASSFTEARRRELVDELAPFTTSLQGHPWEHGFGTDSGRLAHLGGAATRWTPDLTLDWLPLRPVLVCEVAYDHVEGGHFRHPARFVRWRPDRDAASCLLEQLEAPTDALPLPLSP